MYPVKAGLYIAASRDETLLVRVTGFFPYLNVKDGYNLTSYVNGKKLSPIEEGKILLIKQRPEDWIFSTFILNEVATSLLENKPEISLNEEEKQWFIETFKDSKSAGCTDHSLIAMARSKFNLNLEQAISLFNEMDKEYKNGY